MREDSVVAGKSLTCITTSQDGTLTQSSQSCMVVFAHSKSQTTIQSLECACIATSPTCHAGLVLCSRLAVAGKSPRAKVG